MESLKPAEAMQAYVDEIAKLDPYGTLVYERAIAGDD